MGSDWNYYYDFGQERKLDFRKTVEEKETHCMLECSFSCGAGDYVILLPVHGPEELFGTPPYPESAGIEINGRFHSLKDSQSAYIGPHGCRAGFPVHFSGGSNRIRLKIAASRKKSAEALCLHLIPGLPPAEVTEYEGTLHVEREVFREEKSVFSTEGCTPGCGCRKSPGRFGFSKGDGMLDCAMPCLGVVDKMYLCGHPQYRKPFRWTYSTLPEGAALHGSFPPAAQGIERDRIDVNHLSVNWETEFGGRRFACTCSLATPGIMTESDAGRLRLSSLEFAGNYRYALIPGEGDDVKVLSLDRAAEQGIDMAENWLLLFGCTEFPDLPLLIVPDCPPERLEVRRNPGNGRLSELQDGAGILLLQLPDRFLLLFYGPVQPVIGSFCLFGGGFCFVRHIVHGVLHIIQRVTNGLRAGLCLLLQVVKVFPDPIRIQADIQFHFMFRHFCLSPPPSGGGRIPSSGHSVLPVLPGCLLFPHPPGRSISSNHSGA